MARRDADRPKAFVAQAKYPGKCRTCSGGFKVGEEIYVAPFGYSHIEWNRYHNTDACHPERIRERRLQMLDMAHAETLTRVQQQAWADVSDIAIPVTEVGKGQSADELRHALSLYNESSYGRLRWSTYTFIEVMPDGRVRATEYNNLCD